MKNLLNESGFAPVFSLLLIITVIGVLAFLLYSSTAPLNQGYFGKIYSKPESHAQVVPTPIPGVKLTMSPSNVSAQTNQTFTVTLNIDAGADRVSAAELHLQFTAARLQVESVTVSDSLPVILIPTAFNNSTGTIDLTLGSQPTTPKTGTGALATITFKAISAGTANIAYATTTQTASIDKTSNSLVSNTGSTVTVTAPTPIPVADTTPPTVSITSPSNGSNVPRGKSVTITATAQDNVAVTRVEFYINGALKCTDTNSPYSCIWSNIPNASNKKYTLFAKAYDTSGNSSTSSTVTVTAR